MSRARKGAAALVATAAVATPVAMYGGTLVADAPDRDETHPSMFASLPAGDAPDVDWIEGSTYHGRSGFDAAVPVSDVRSFVPYRGGLLMTTPDRVVVLDDQGSVVSDRCGSSSIGQDAVGEVVVTAALQFECNDDWRGGALVWSSVTGTYDEPLATVNGEFTEPVAIRGDDTFYNALSAVDGTSRAWHLATGLGPPEEIPGIASLADVTPDGRWLAGVTTDGRSVVADAISGAVRTELDGTPLAFSRNGDLVATVSSRLGLQVLDATSGELLRAAGTSVTPEQVAWESSDTLLAIAEEGGQEAIVRLTLDADLTLASAPSPTGTLALVDQP